MRTVFLSILLLSCIGGFTQPKKGQFKSSQVAQPRPHYLPEYTFDVPSDPGLWMKQTPGLHVAFGTTDELYLRSEVPVPAIESKTWEETGWRGERLNAQVLVWSKDTLEQIRFIASDLRNIQGVSIDKSNIRLNMVRYVVSNFPYASKNSGCDVIANDTVYLMPDRLEKFERFDLPGRTVRPVWISVDIPAGTEAGVYNGILEINSEKHHIVLNLIIQVQRPILPKPHDWKFRLDLWQNPWVLAEYYKVEPWWEEHRVLLKKHLQLYADAGGKYITTYTIHSPWSDNSYMLEETMIDWRKGKDGSWKFDYHIFDQYVQLAMEVGIDQAITLYTPVPWGYRFRYLDEVVGNYVYEIWPPDSAPFKLFWNFFLDDLKLHLQTKGWFEKTYLGINENPLPVTLAAAKVIKDHSKNWKITYAGEWHPELSPVLDDYSPVITSEPAPKDLKGRRELGYTTTYYVACAPSQPNNFIFSPPVEGRYIPWYAAAYGYDGFLRWAYDAWPADPARDARHTLWPAGDCFFVYPGGNSSIRFEKLREGIVDYEKIRILKDLASESNDKKVKGLLKELEALQTSLVSERDYSKRDFNIQTLTRAIEKGREIIMELSDALGN